jgi:hypothetical protein
VQPLILDSPDPPRPYLASLISLSAYWFGWSVLWMPLLVILIPHQVRKHSRFPLPWHGKVHSITVYSMSLVAFHIVGIST